MTFNERLPSFVRSPVAWVIGAVIAVVLLATALSYMVSSTYLARYMEHKMNRSLKGYTVHIGKAYFHPLTLAFDLKDVTLVQQANPKPPVASIKGLHLSVHWGALLSARLVGDFLIDRPKLYIDLNNIREEEKSKVPVKKKGWQEAVQSIYPLKINVFRVTNGDVTYVDQGPHKPLRASRVYLRASNIRNIRYSDTVYPSPVHVEGILFDTGKATMTGNANFLLEPHFGIKADVAITDMDLGYFRSVTERHNITLKKGTASAKGNLEYSPKVTEVSLKQLVLNGVDADYIHLSETAAAEKERIEKAKVAAKELREKPEEAKIRVEALKITNSSFGYVNKASNPNYRVFIDKIDATMNNFSNQFAEGPARVELKGQFMGTGDTKATATFRPEKKSPDFDLNVAIVDTQMPAMSDLFSAYGNFDIKRGLFSFFTELTVKDNRIDGYVKPMFKDLEVTDRRTKQQKGIFHRLYVAVVKGISKLLENPETKQIATEARISGPVGGARTSTWQVIFNLVRNAFIQAILPGFEREVTGGGKK